MRLVADVIAILMLLALPPWHMATINYFASWGFFAGIYGGAMFLSGAAASTRARVALLAFG
ncbi:hypothetical protein [Mesorhizobium sp. WSM4313]|uniref:hypothetical protein n=1 Tax=Mesorhizobium sp. WSM4313 TaxID=2029412 RepID=UPI001140A3F6|nr:hypothetical protein [Mesorhizobium sp. WSM4313]